VFRFWRKIDRYIDNSGLLPNILMITSFPEQHMAYFERNRAVTARMTVSVKLQKKKE